MYHTEAGSDAELKTQFSQRTPTQTQRYEPQSAAKKKKLSSSSVSAFATAPVTVVSDNVVHYVDLKQHFLKHPTKIARYKLRSSPDPRENGARFCIFCCSSCVA